ncbi:hypothetical protein GH714_029109 [Hevea brasiliensis]|uniref:Uncharacterized protein n=1 Tax=Hevea brasiliensis TaxID=3981 RepID=A0A6A6LBU4_HEVBR|nr:hypothetical protein GH714_029109 [Hevea brasiliensis]
MENKGPKLLPATLAIFIVSLTSLLSFPQSIKGAVSEKIINDNEESNLETYIIFVTKPEGGVSEQSQDLHSWYQSFLPASISNQQRRIIYSYRNVVSGFAAKLTADEAKAMEEKGGLVSARPQKILPLHTTHSPNFLGLYQNLGLWRNSNYGHGTHTASTAAGSFVSAANVFGNANGTAVGMAPLAHLAIYKVCSDFGCSESDILAAMDTAVEEGVDVLSLSLGGRSAPFTADGIAVGAFGAIQNGVFVSCSAGNSGPGNFSLSNEAPWILTVGASTIDRSIRATVKLGNNEKIFGESLFQPQLSTQNFWPLVYPGKDGNQSSAVCAPGSLENFDVKGKIVLCDRGGLVGRVEKGQVVKDAGGIGMILANEEFDGYSTLADAHVLPASHVSYTDGVSIKTYVNSTASPTVMLLFEGTVIGVKTAPMVSSFSSRGPSLASPGILKPDIIGTSMSCPHLSGIAALLKSAHPDWSPAAIKSAIMTTGDLVNLGGQPIVDERLLPADILATGAGHVNPSRASDPGLVYDIQPDDYIPYLCGLGYTDRDITYLAQRKVKCSEVQSIPEAQLNYPSFSIMFGPKTQTYTRTITNVGPATSSYTVSVAPPPGVDIKIMPSKIVFTKAKEKATYAVTFTKTSNENNGAFVQGHLKWDSDHHSVRSPILFLFSNED